MSTITFSLNSKLVSTDLPGSTILVDYLRDQGFTGTKIGCREGDCGACTVLVGEDTGSGVKYESYVSCLTPIRNIDGKYVETIETENIIGLKRIQEVFEEENATQCGFCTPGFIMSIAGAQLIGINPKKSIDGNICRCTGYNSIIRAINLLEENVVKIACNIPLPKPEHTFEADILVGGGTDLYVQKRDVLLQSRIQKLSPAYRYIRELNDSFEIGAGATMSDFMNHPQLKNLLNMDNFELIASTQIRNMATISGNIVNASPIADFAIILLALDAQLELNSGRKVYLDAFYRGYKDTDLKEGEFISKITFPKRQGGLFFEKVSKRTYLDIASVNSVIWIYENSGKIEGIRIAAGGVAPIPLFLRKTSSFLLGKQIGPDVLRKAISIMNEEIVPISDIRGSKEYKSRLCSNLLLAHFSHFIDESLLMEVLF